MADSENKLRLSDSGDVTHNPNGMLQSTIGSLLGATRRQLDTNRDEVKQAEEKRCDKVYWGKEIDHRDYRELIAAAVIDVFGGGGSATATKIQSMLAEQPTSLTKQ